MNPKYNKLEKYKGFLWIYDRHRDTQSRVELVFLDKTFTWDLEAILSVKNPRIHSITKQLNVSSF